MKLSVLAIVISGFCLISGAGELTCNTTPHKLRLGSEGSTRCHSLKLEGIYSLKLCSNNRGILYGADETVRYLFLRDDMWIARADTINMNTGNSSTDTLRINSDHSEFIFSKVRMDRSGNLMENTTCKLYSLTE
jgi:hypothetical protein